MSVIYLRSQYDAPKLGKDMARQYAPLEAFVHHSADADGAAALYNTKAEQVAKLHRIDAQHRAQGWAMAGYHWAIFQMVGERHVARAFQLRPAIYVPAAQQDHNTRTLAIVVIGNGNTEPLHSDTEDAICRVIRKYQQVRKVGGHRDVVATECPGSKFYAHVPAIAKRLGLDTVR